MLNRTNMITLMFNINVIIFLEFVAVIGNLWLMLLCLRQQGVRDHVVFSVLADNTSALSWLRYAARTQRPFVRRLALFLQALIMFAGIPLWIQVLHIAGEKNEVADILSRFS